MRCRHLIGLIRRLHVLNPVPAAHAYVFAIAVADIAVNVAAADSAVVVAAARLQVVNPVPTSAAVAASAQPYVSAAIIAAVTVAVAM